MKVRCTQNFISNIEKLERNNSYSNVLEDVCNFLNDKNISELHQMNDVINKAPEKYSLNKYRIINSLTNKGKSSSYRCVCVCLPQENSIYLDTIYPKTGSLGKENLEKDEYKAIAKNVLRAIQQNELFDLNVEMKLIAKKK